jgi:hypothetical protein
MQNMKTGRVCSFQSKLSYSAFGGSIGLSEEDKQLDFLQAT